ncbi:MAG TPA: FliH/SctL family protein [Stellaceae bacterium]|jgi:flagellar assembly protein FliH|nr:FliH/SctL family protein [Stellaceae bacterium]
MTSRVDADNPSIHPWKFPVLEGQTAPSEPPTPATPTLATLAPAVPDPEPAEPSPNSEAAFAEIAAAAPLDANPVAKPIITHHVVQDHAALDRAEAYALGLAQGTEEGRARGHAEGRAEGHAEGFAVGLAEGRRAGEAALAEQAQRLAALLEALGAPIPALEQTVEAAVAALALEIARAVIGGEVARSRDYLVRLIREAIAKVPLGTGKPRLIVNPDDLELLRALAPDIEEGGTALVADETIEPGGCIVVANADGAVNADRRWRPRSGEGVSQVDLTLASRWRDVMHALFESDND